MNPNAKLERKVWITIGSAVVLLLCVMYARFSPVIFLVLASSCLVIALTFWLLSRIPYVDKNRLRNIKSPSIKRQLVNLSLFIIPMSAGLVWGVVIIGVSSEYLLKHFGTQAFATVEKYERYQGNTGRSASLSPAINVYINYDGHHGVLQQSTTELGYANDIYNEFLNSAQQGKEIPVKYLKGAPFIVLSNSQLGLPAAARKPSSDGVIKTFKLQPSNNQVPVTH